MKFLLARHGEIEASWLPDMGHDDPPLTDLGYRQARALAGELQLISQRGAALSAVYTSPLRAASMTAESITEALGLPAPLVSEALGTLTPEILPAEGGMDALEALQQRAWQTIEALRDQHDAGDIVVVSHELTIRSLVCRALNMPLSQLRRYCLDPASLSAIEFRRAPSGDLRTILALLNEVCYLEAVRA